MSTNSKDIRDEAACVATTIGKVLVGDNSHSHSMPGILSGTLLAALAVSREIGLPPIAVHGLLAAVESDFADFLASISRRSGPAKPKAGPEMAAAVAAADAEADRIIGEALKAKPRKRKGA